LVLAAAMSVILAPGRIALGQDNDVVEDDAIVPAPKGVIVVRQPNLDQIDNWVFGRFGGSAAARARFDAMLDLRVDDIVRACDVTDAQRHKLKLAGRGDIKRLFDRVEELKRAFQQNPNSPDKNVWQAIQPLQAELNAGLFGDASIFQKSIKKTLSDDQFARYDELLHKRQKSRYRTTVEWFVVHLDKVLGFSELQRRRISELIISDTEPPKKPGQSDYWYLMFQISKLPEANFKPIFDAPQWRLLSRQLVQARGMEQWLRANGVLSDQKNEGSRGAAMSPISVVPARPLEPAARPDARAFRPGPAQPVAATKNVANQD
jgi:hypothetical protein